MTEQASLDIAPTEVQITDPEHIANIWMDFGASIVVKAAREIADKHRIVGMALVADLLQARGLELATKTKLQNVGFAAKHGMDFTSGALLLDVRGGDLFLVIKPLSGEPA